MEKIFTKKIYRKIVLIALCFLLTSTGWLSWEYHLMSQVSSSVSDFSAMVAGYLLQAAGIGFFALILKKRPHLSESVFPAVLAAHMICMVPAVISPFAAGTLIFGFMMNVFCGMIAGYYLYCLMAVPGNKKAAVFGIGYGISILASWLLSITDHGRLYYSRNVLLVCLVLTAVIAALTWKKKEEVSKEEDKKQNPAERSFLLLAGMLVLLFSIVNSSGFAFPTADLGKSVNLELSRLVYAIGLVIAGFMTDKDRKYGALAALIALMTPFIILALRGETLSAVIFWVLSYFTFGFYSVYRIILFSDVASEKNLIWLSGFGLMIGRIGDAVGEVICLTLTDHLPVMVIVTALLFACAVAVFFRVYQLLYIPETVREQSEKERFAQFSVEHDLSPREQDMLRLVLEKRTNGEIAEILSISENTVKFHIRNLLQKTGCKNRNDLNVLYIGYFSK